MFDPATDDPENRRTHMGKVKEYAQDWLERGGFELGYDMGNLPALGDFNGILLNDMPAEEYVFLVCSRIRCLSWIFD